MEFPIETSNGLKELLLHPNLREDDQNGSWKHRSSYFHKCVFCDEPFQKQRKGKSKKQRWSMAKNHYNNCDCLAIIMAKRLNNDELDAVRRINKFQDNMPCNFCQRFTFKTQKSLEFHYSFCDPALRAVGRLQGSIE